MSTIGELHRRYLQLEATGRREEGRQFLLKAMELGGPSPPPSDELARAYLSFARDQVRLGEADRGFAVLNYVRSELIPAGHADLHLLRAATQADMQLALGRVKEILLDGEEQSALLEAAKALGDSEAARLLLAARTAAALALGKVDVAESLLGARPARTTDDVRLEVLWAGIDIARGRLVTARRRAEVLSLVSDAAPEVRVSLSQIRAECSLWLGQPARAVDEAEAMLSDVSVSGDRTLAAAALGLAIRACAELHADGLARADEDVTTRASDSAASIRRLAGRLNPVEWVMHAGCLVADAEGSEWYAELARLDDHPYAAVRWASAAERWEAHGRPHRAAYARLRQAERLLGDGDGEAAAEHLRVAWRQALQHQPLGSTIAALAERAGLELPDLADANCDDVGGTPAEGMIARRRAAGASCCTKRELEILQHMGTGLKAEAVGRRLGISERTVRKHLEHVYAKLGCNDRLMAVQRAFELGLIPPPRWSTAGSSERSDLGDEEGGNAARLRIQPYAGTSEVPEDRRDGRATTLRGI